MKVEIYTGPSCGYCNNAKALLTQRGIEYTEISAAENREALIARVEATGAETPRTIPQIFIDGKYIGGFDDLSVFLKPTE